MLQVHVYYSFVDYESLAGIVAVEKAVPCIKIKRSFTETKKPFGLGCIIPMALPKTVENLKPVWPFLGRNDISRSEMATLYKGVKLLEQGGETGQANAPLISNNDTSFNKDFADVYAKVLLIGTETTGRVVLSEGSSTC